MPVIKDLEHVYRSAAKSRDLTYLLSFDDFKRLSFSNCNYCGQEPAARKVSRTKEKQVIYVNGLDRRNNLLGYTLSNVVPCCWQCNLAKTDMLEDEFINFVKKIHLHIKVVDNHKQPIVKYTGE